MSNVYRFMGGPVTVVGQNAGDLVWMDKGEVIILLHERKDDPRGNMSETVALQTFFLRQDGKTYWTHIPIRTSSRFVKIDE